MQDIEFFRAKTPEEREAINVFLARHNQRGQGSVIGYVAYYAAVCPGDDRPLLDRMVAAAKFCPLHTPQAAKFFAGEDWRHVYCLQRLAADHPPENLLSRFLGWCLREVGRDNRVWYTATYADTSTFDPRSGRPHNGGIYRATNAVYCGLTTGGSIEGFIHDGVRRSMRKGPKTYTLADIPTNARILRSNAKHRYCWPVGPTLIRARRRVQLESRMKQYQFVPAWQPRLLAAWGRLKDLGGRLWARFGFAP